MATLTFSGFAVTIDGLGTWVSATPLIWITSTFIWVLPGPWQAFKKRDRDSPILEMQ